METYTELRDFVDNPLFHQQRQQSIQSFDLGKIDAPLVGIVGDLLTLPHCFTLQSCYGHFLYSGQNDPFDTEPLPMKADIATVDYKIAYVALCIENSNHGRALFHDLKEIPRVDPEYVQFGCAEWFWEQQANSFALQVEPNRHKTKDRICVDYQEALHIEKTRNQFFAQIKKLLEIQLGSDESG